MHAAGLALFVVSGVIIFLEYQARVRPDRIRTSRTNMPTVLSIQSWVACGNVGNTAALFPLQRLGCETWSLNTVAFSNHTGYGKWRGATVPGERDRGSVCRDRRIGLLPRCDAVLSGYLGEAETGPVLLDIVARVKQANPKALFACDPVMGDIGPGWYVRAGVPEFYRDHALAAADIVTPNRFELEWLTGQPVRHPGGSGEAAAALRERGPGTVLVTSLDLVPDAHCCGRRRTRRRMGGRDAAPADRSDGLRRCGGRSVPRLAAQRQEAARGAGLDDRRDIRGDRGDDACCGWRVGAGRGAGRTRLTHPIGPCPKIIEGSNMATSDKIAVITGAGSGIGRASALALIEAGFAAVLAGRRHDMLEETAALAKNRAVSHPGRADGRLRSGRDCCTVRTGQTDLWPHRPLVQQCRHQHPRHPVRGSDLRAMVECRRGQPDRLVPVRPARLPDDEGAAAAGRADHQQRIGVGACAAAQLRRPMSRPSTR